MSSPQLQSAKRGFSFSVDGPLDMRMDPTSGLTALQWINTAPEDEITQVINNYGEERFASRIARAITNQRSDQEITTTFELKNLVSTAIPRKFHTGKEPATKTFQAIRIFLNKELDDLRYFCEHVVPLLANGARIAIISFHSLEDRIVKTCFKRLSTPDVPERLPLRARDMPQTLLSIIGRVMKPSVEEITANPRSRSARLRVAERCPS